MIPYNPQGLTPEEVAASRAAHGENIITPQRDDSAWRLLAEKFRDPIIIVLLVAAALSLAMAFMEGNFTETIGILCAILLATCVGFLFEWDAMRRFRRLNRVNDEQPVKVRRGGVMREIPRREVVVGDLVSLEAGETVPADGELVEAVSLQMDESTLTGEPETAKYVDEELFDPEATYPSNRLLRGTPEAIAQFAVPVATLCTNYVLLARLGDMAVNAAAWSSRPSATPPKRAASPNRRPSRAANRRRCTAS